MKAGGMRLAALLLLCAAPHLVRMASSSLMPNDGFYAHAAWMYSHGAQPWLHVTQVAFPLAEYVLAGVIRVFGHDVRVFELVNLTVVLAIAATLWTTARRFVLAGTSTDGPRERAATLAGVVAALGFAWSAWVIHFHLGERETWAALGTVLALASLARSPAPAGLSWRRAAAIGSALALAFCLKITAIMAAGGVLLHLLARREPASASARLRDALRVAAVLLGLAGGATLLCWLVWGPPFLQQVFLFGMFRGRDVAGPRQALADLLVLTDPVLLLGFAALLVHGLRRLRGPWGAPALVMLADLAFLLLISPTLWDHNLISLAPSAALLLAGAVADRPRRTAALVLAATLLLGALQLVPRDWASALGQQAPRAPLGPVAVAFDGWPREEFRRRATFLERHSQASEVVVTMNPWWSLQAGRVEAVRYFDLQAIALGLRETLAADGLRSAWARRATPLLLAPAGVKLPRTERFELLGSYFGRLVACGLQWERPLLLAALQAREIGLVMEPLPAPVLRAEDLLEAGYVRFEDEELGLAGWRPGDGASRPVLREIYPR